MERQRKRWGGKAKEGVRGGNGVEWGVEVGGEVGVEGGWCGGWSGGGVESGGGG